MRIFIMCFLLLFVLALPASADSLLPGFEDIDQRGAVLHGGDDGEQIWYMFSANLEGEASAGAILDLFGFAGIDPSRLYGWWRYDADFDSPDEDEFQDYIFGVEFGLGESSIDDEHFWYTFTERIDLNDPVIDIGITGAGVRWTIDDNFTTGLSAGYDANETILLKVTANANPTGELWISGYMWSVFDDDPWGFWQVTASHPITEDIDMMVLYEHSTRSDPLIMAGISYQM